MGAGVSPSVIERIAHILDQAPPDSPARARASAMAGPTPAAGGATGSTDGLELLRAEMGEQAELLRGELAAALETVTASLARRTAAQVARAVEQVGRAERERAEMLAARLDAQEARMEAHARRCDEALGEMRRLLASSRAAARALPAAQAPPAAQERAAGPQAAELKSEIASLRTEVRLAAAAASSALAAAGAAGGAASPRHGGGRLRSPLAAEGRSAPAGRRAERSLRAAAPPLRRDGPAAERRGGSVPHGSSARRPLMSLSDSSDEEDPSSGDEEAFARGEEWGARGAARAADDGGRASSSAARRSARTARLERRCAKLEWQLSNALSHAEAFQALLAANPPPLGARGAGAGVRLLGLAPGAGAAGSPAQARQLVWPQSPGCSPAGALSSPGARAAPCGRGMGSSSPGWRQGLSQAAGLRRAHSFGRYPRFT